MSIKNFLRPSTLTFVGHKNELKNVYTFSFKRSSKNHWQAGQHAMLEIKPKKGPTTRRMFSLSSAPHEETINITTHWLGEERASSFKKALMALEPNDKIKLRGPVGPMFVKDPLKNNVFIAHSLGITPFRSIIAEHAITSNNLHGTLYFVNSLAHEILFEDELKKLSAQLKNFQIKFLTNAEEVLANLDKHDSSKLSASIIYLAGAPKTVKQYKKDLKILGVRAKNIKNDSFYGYK